MDHTVLQTEETLITSINQTKPKMFDDTIFLSELKQHRKDASLKIHLNKEITDHSGNESWQCESFLQYIQYYLISIIKADKLCYLLFD